MKYIKPMVGIILVFILGAASGSLVTYLVSQSHIEAILSGGPRAREDVLLKRLTRQLDLDSQQREQIKAIIHKTHEDIRQVRQKIHPQIETMLADSQQRISALLRPEQQEKFKKLWLKVRFAGMADNWQVVGHKTVCFLVCPERPLV